MKKLWFKTLLRSPLKTAVTFLLLAASAFLLTRNLTDYISSRSAYRNALKNYEGVLTAERPFDLDNANMNMPLFLLTDPTMPENRWWTYEDQHVPDLDGRRQHQRLVALYHRRDGRAGGLAGNGGIRRPAPAHSGDGG